MLNGAWRQTPLVSKWILSSNRFSIVSSVYDPLGVAAPFVLLAKRLLQVESSQIGMILFLRKVRWERWMEDLPKLLQFSIDHCVKPAGFNFISSSQLHHFFDASETSFGSVSYLRLVNGQGAVHCSFLCAKSRVAPLKMITISRLEFSATTISVKQDKVLKRELEI